MRFYLALASSLPLLVASASLAASSVASRHASPQGAVEVVAVNANHAVNSINPRNAVGGGVDRIPVAAIDHDFQPKSLKESLSAGWQPVTYRQNTDLAVQYWHWNSVGTWSEPGDKGYFTGDANSHGFIRYSYGYDLPHRGFTRNDGTVFGYSRLTDGDLNTYWKSNPYLTQRYTGESDALHPQWVVIDLGHPTLVDALRIAWAAPYATHYVVQYWNGPPMNQDPFHKPLMGAWSAFPDGVVTDGSGGTPTLRLSPAPLLVRFVRIRMTASSDTCDDQGSSDPRNCVGYAIRELYMGTVSKDGAFHDLLRHTPGQTQTATFCSSVDPWHTAKSRFNPKEAQVGFDLFYTSGVTRGLPALIPIAMLYDTPENAAAEVRYLENHKYPIAGIEMGEEADGQYFSPEDYGALYIQFAAALHKVDPTLKLGGPSFQGTDQDIRVWPDAEGRTSWLGRFLDYMRAHHQMRELSFFSFEHYPYPPCTTNWASLYNEPMLITHIMQVWRADGLPPSIPVYLTESNLSSSTSENYMDIFGGLWLADYIGSYLSAGGNEVYFFHELPLRMEAGCNNSPGTFGMFKVDANYKIEQPLSQYFAARMINLQWLEPSGENELYPATTDIEDGAGHKLVTAYADHRPDGDWSLMLVNNDQFLPHTVRVEIQKDGHTLSFTGSVHEAVFGSAQYQWHPAHRDSNAHLPLADMHAANFYAGGTADPDGPIAQSTVRGGVSASYVLPAASIVVLRGHID